ncbi:MAG TPA: DNA gyrase modulator, partial [Gemmatimonadaceae bacterium]|nr:DNA gyrase modulator [Gemmatimonadaceae bacterium]
MSRGNGPRSLLSRAVPRYLSREQAQELTQRVLGFATADETRVSVGSGTQGNTRFAVSQISTGGDNFDTSVTIRAVFGKRAGSSTTNALDDASLRRAVDTA